MNLIFHITARDAALAARQSGEYRPESLTREGFIHLSGPHQVLEVANRFYVGQTGLVLLVVDPARLKATLKYEAPVHPAAAKDEDFSPSERLNSDRKLNTTDTSNVFPHLYGPLNFDAVLAIHDFSPNPDGIFSLPNSRLIEN